MATPIIDREIQKLFDPLSDDEFRRLSVNIEGEGCRHPLIVWKENNILLDGHHRLAVCEKHKIKYEVEYLKFPSRELAIEWVVAKHPGRKRSVTLCPRCARLGRVKDCGNCK
jgi:ParB-like chromosome segregation protein Spo0J